MSLALDKTRLIAASALLVVVAAAAFVLLRDDSYTIHARFLNAGQLIEEGRVQVAGRKVGSVAEVGVTDDGQAQIVLSLDDDLTLRQGTRAAIRAVGQAGIANRFIELTPGPPDAPPLGDGAVLDTDQTSGIVNIDALLDSFGPAQRANMRALIANSAQVFAGSGSAYFNRMLGKLSPALAELNGLWGDLARDRVALTGLVDSAAEAAGAIASRSSDLTSAVQNTATALGAIGNERRALAGMLTRAPAVLAQAETTLANTDSAVTALRPALREIPPTAAPLRELLERTASVLPRARPVVAQLGAQLPALREALTGLPPLRHPAVLALRSTGRAMKTTRHIFRGMRFFGSDLVIGALTSVGGAADAPYDARGHYGKLNFVQSPETLAGGRVATFLDTRALVPGLLDVRTKLDRRCPGGNVPPAPDGSSPWILGQELCTADHNTPASVIEP